MNFVCVQNRFIDIIIIYVYKNIIYTILYKV